MLEKQFNDEEILDRIITDMMIKKGEPNPSEPSPKKTDLINQLSEKIERTIISALPIEKIEELNNVLDRSAVTKEDVENIIKSANLDVADLTKTAIDDFRNSYLSETGGNN